MIHNGYKSERISETSWSDLFQEKQVIYSEIFFCCCSKSLLRFLWFSLFSVEFSWLVNHEYLLGSRLIKIFKKWKPFFLTLRVLFFTRSKYSSSCSITVSSDYLTQQTQIPSCIQWLRNWRKHVYLWAWPSIHFNQLTVIATPLEMSSP